MRREKKFPSPEQEGIKKIFEGNGNHLKSLGRRYGKYSLKKLPFESGQEEIAHK